jgi:hypothetical protein
MASYLNFNTRTRMRRFLKNREKDYLESAKKIEELEIEIADCKTKLQTTSQISVGSYLIDLGYCDVESLQKESDMVITLSSTGKPVKVQIPIFVTTEDHIQQYQQLTNEYGRVDDDLCNYQYEEFERRVDDDRWR